MAAVVWEGRCVTPSGELTEHAAVNRLSPISKRLLDLLVASVLEVWDSVLVGSRLPVVAERYRRMSSPALGDWVLVNAVARGTDPYLRVGRWTGWWTHLHWYEDDEAVWAVEHGDRPFAVEEVYGLELVDGQRMNWTNVSLLTIPPTLSEHMREWRKNQFP